MALGCGCAPRVVYRDWGCKGPLEEYKVKSRYLEGRVVYLEEELTHAEAVNKMLWERQK